MPRIEPEERKELCTQQAETVCKRKMAYTQSERMTLMRMQASGSIFMGRCSIQGTGSVAS